MADETTQTAPANDAFLKVAPAGTKNFKVNRNVCLPGSTVVFRDKPYTVKDDFTVDLPSDASDDELKGIVAK